MQDSGIGLQYIVIPNPSIKVRHSKAASKEALFARTSLREYFDLRASALPDGSFRCRWKQERRVLHLPLSSLFIWRDKQFLTFGSPQIGAICGLNFCGGFSLIPCNKYIHTGSNFLYVHDNPSAFGADKGSGIQKGIFCGNSSNGSLIFHFSRLEGHLHGLSLHPFNLLFDSTQSKESDENSTQPRKEKGYVWGVFSSKESAEIAFRYTLGPIALYGGSFLLYRALDYRRRWRRWLFSCLGTILIAGGFGAITMPRYWQDACE